MTLFFSVGRLRELKCGLQCEETGIKVCYLRPFPVRILGHPDVVPQTRPVDWPPPQLERLPVQHAQLSLGPDDVDRAFPIVSPEKEIRVLTAFDPPPSPSFCLKQIYQPVRPSLRDFHQPLLLRLHEFWIANFLVCGSVCETA